MSSGPISSGKCNGGVSNSSSGNSMKQSTPVAFRFPRMPSAEHFSMFVNGSSSEAHSVAGARARSGHEMTNGIRDNGAGSSVKAKGQRRARTSAGNTPGLAPASGSASGSSASVPLAGGGESKPPVVSSSNSAGIISRKGASGASVPASSAGVGDGDSGNGSNASAGRSPAGGACFGKKVVAEKGSIGVTAGANVNGGSGAGGSAASGGGSNGSGSNGGGSGSGSNGKGRGKGDGSGKREGGGDEESLRQNDNYVSYLNQTGSMIALAQMLDRQSLEDA